MPPGPEVEVKVVEQALLVCPVKGIGQLFGILHDRIPSGGPLGWEEERRIMEEAVARQVADE